MNKNEPTMTTIARQPKDGTYHFIRVSNLQRCTTQDLYFESDDEKFENGNYFLDKHRADELAEALQEKYSGPLQENVARRNKNRDHLCSELTKLDADWDTTTPVEELDREVLEKFTASVLLAVKEYKRTRDELGATFSQMQKEIKSIITKYPKI